MHARYRFQGKFISADKAEKLSHFKKYQDKIQTDIIEKGTKTFRNVSGFKKDTALKVVYAMEKDRQTKEDQRSRRKERERERTRDFQRKQVEPVEPRRHRGGRDYSDIDYDTGGSGWGGAGYFPEDEEDYDYLPDLDPLPFEDDLIDDYFDDALEVADIDSDIYAEQ